MTGSQSRSFLLVENPSKGNNLGPLFRCASAFAIDHVVLVGYEKFSAEGSHGAARHVRTKSFPTFEQATRYLRADETKGGCGCVSITGLLGGAAFYSPDGCTVHEAGDMVMIEGTMEETTLGIKMKGDDQMSRSRSMPVFVRPFRGNTCFLVSKNWSGLPSEQARFCDSFIHVPHCPVITSDQSLGTSSSIVSMKSRPLVDVQSFLSIVLHHFTAWARYDERRFEGQKFDVARFRKGEDETSANEKRAKRAEMRATAGKDAEEGLAEGAWGILFDD